MRLRHQESCPTTRHHNSKDSNSTQLGDGIAGETTTAVMLLLDYQNVLIQSVLTERFSG
jgi:hypothetical protein